MTFLFFVPNIVVRLTHQYELRSELSWPGTLSAYSRCLPGCAALALTVWMWRWSLSFSFVITFFWSTLFIVFCLFFLLGDSSQIGLYTPCIQPQDTVIVSSLVPSPCTVWLMWCHIHHCFLVTRIYLFFFFLKSSSSVVSMTMKVASGKSELRPELK